MGQKNTSLFKVGAIYTLSNILVRGITFLTTPLFTRIMSQSDFGQYSSITSWISILLTIVTLDLYSAVSVAKYDYNDDIDRYLSSNLLFGNIVTLLFCIITEFNITYAENFLDMDSKYIRIMYAYLLFYPASQFLLAKFRIYNEYKQVVQITLATVIVSTIAQIVLVLCIQDKLFGRFLGGFGAVTIVNIVLWVSIIAKGRCFSFKYIKHAVFLAVPLIPHVLSGVLLNSSDRVMINSICGSTDAALYSLAYTVSSITSVFSVAVNQAWVPWMYDRMENGRGEIKKASQIYALGFAFLSCILMALGPEIVLIFGGNEYYESCYVIAPVVVSLMLQFIYTQYVNIEFYRKKNVWISVATIGATLINIGLNYILLPIFGYLVAAYTTIVGYLFMVVFHYIFVKHKTNDGDIYDEKVFVITLVAVLVNMGVFLASYTNNYYRISILVAYLILLIIVLRKNKDKVKQMMSGVKKVIRR